MPAPPASPTRDGRADASMSLLADMVAGAVDPAYAAAARRASRPRPGLSPDQADGGQADGARADGRPGSAGEDPPRRSASLVAGLLLLGTLTGTAAAQVRQRDASAGTSRAALVADVRTRTAASDALARSAAALSAQVAAERSAALGTGVQGRATRRQLVELELAAGQVPVHGPGIVVRLDDAHGTAGGASPGPGAGGGAPAAPLTTVQDRDLQDLVNGLWAAGAEAVSVNDLRVTGQTAIRTAGEAILVDFRPVSPPYLVRAVGAPDRLQTAFVDGATGRRFATYTSLYGLGFGVRAADDLRLPAAGAPDLHLVRPVAPR